MVVFVLDLELDSYIRTTLARLLQTLYYSQTINTFFILNLLLLIGSDPHSVYSAQYDSSTHRSLGALGRTESMVSVHDNEGKNLEI